MSLNYQQLMKQISVKAKKYGDSLQPPCSSQALADLQVRTQKELGTELPPGYSEFLRLHDGLDWNGLVIFASKTVPITGYKDRFIEGFVDANMGFRSSGWKKKFVVLGDNGMDLYVFEPDVKKFSARDRVSLDPNETYPSFEKMLSAALANRL